MNARFDKLFREEAVRHHRAGHRSSGDVLRLEPRWATAAAWCLYAAFAGCVLYAALARVDEYVSAPAIVCLDGQRALVAARAGVVERVLVREGQRVERGQPLVQLEDDGAAARVLKERRGFDDELAEMLRHAGEHTARPALAAARERLDAAKAALADRTLIAGGAAVVVAVDARAGQAVARGAPLVTLAPVEPRFTIVALMPGAVRPRLAPGQTLRVTLAGYRDAPIAARVDEVAPWVIGPTEAQNALGPRADLVHVDGPVVVVRAQLAATGLRVDGDVLTIAAGMTGTAQLRIARRSLLAMLAPWLFDVRQRAG